MPRIPGSLDIAQVSADPTAPQAGRSALYFKSDGLLYSKASDGTVRVQGGGGSAPANMAKTDATNTFTADQGITKAAPKLTLTDPNSKTGTIGVATVGNDIAFLSQPGDLVIVAGSGQRLLIGSNLNSLSDFTTLGNMAGAIVSASTSMNAPQISATGANGVIDNGNRCYSDSNPPQDLMMTPVTVDPPFNASLGTVFARNGALHYRDATAGGTVATIGDIILRTTTASTQSPAAASTYANALAPAALTIANLASGTWVWEIEGMYNTSATSVGMRFGFNAGGTTTSFSAQGQYAIATAAAGGAMNQIAQQGAGSTLLGTATTSAGATNLPFRVSGSFVTTTVGNFVVKFGLSAAGTFTVPIGATLRIARIA